MVEDLWGKFYCTVDILLLIRRRYFSKNLIYQVWKGVDIVEIASLQFTYFSGKLDYGTYSNFFKRLDIWNW